MILDYLSLMNCTRLLTVREDQIVRFTARQRPEVANRLIRVNCRAHGQIALVGLNGRQDYSRPLPLPRCHRYRHDALRHPVALVTIWTETWLAPIRMSSSRKPEPSCMRKDDRSKGRLAGVVATHQERDRPKLQRTRVVYRSVAFDPESINIGLRYRSEHATQAPHDTLQPPRLHLMP